MSKSNKSATVAVVDAQETVKATKRQKPAAAKVQTPVEQTVQTLKPATKKPKKGETVVPVSINTSTHAGGIAFTATRPGVIAVMIEHLSKATKEQPVTKETILADLVVRFPERTADGMKATLMMQVPSGLRTEKRIIVRKSEDKSKPGYWIDVEATAAAQAEWKAQTGK